ncbi:MAG: DUF3800 domain-containing protein [Kiloniellaceae bacterium]
MLRAYIDDSMGRGRVLVMGGFVATRERWERFSDEWRQRLEHAPWDVFKMNEVWHRGGDESMEHAKWHYFTIRDHVQGALAMVIPLDPLKRAVQKTGLTAIGNPYIWAIKGVINLTAQHQTEWGVSGPIDFIFDERGEKRQVQDGWEIYKATIPDSVKGVTGRDPIFENDERVLPLQAADMWAWWCRKCWLEDGALRNDKFPIPWGSIGEIPTMIFQWTEKDIEDEFSRVLRDLEAGTYGQLS